MTTFDPLTTPSSVFAPQGHEPASAVDGVATAPPRLPDVDTLTRLANAIFSAGFAAEPGDVALPGTTAQAIGIPGPSAGGLRVPSGLDAETPAAASPAAIPWLGEDLSPRRLAAPVTSPRPPLLVPVVSGSRPYFLDGMARPFGHARHGETPHREDFLSGVGRAGSPFDVEFVRRDFPILRETVHGRPLIWFDNAATTQKPRAVIERLAYFYEHENSNIHRGAHRLAARATDAYEEAREKVGRFLNASSSQEIVFVRGATEAINLVARSWGRSNIEAGDEIVVTWLEHHANIVPWQRLCTETGARLRVVPVDDRGQVRLDAYEDLLGPRTRLVAFTQVSNALGTITPAQRMVEMARRHGARVLIDGAQGVPHLPVDVQALDCDWYVFSGHKLFAPTGIGALYGKASVLEAMPPWQSGGNMIRDVTFEKTEYQSAPQRFEAGTGSIADAVGLGAAIDYLQGIGIETLGRYEHALLVHATRLLAAIPGLRLIGTAAEKAAVVSFVLDGVDSEEVGKALDREGIAVRAGHHCAQPILRRFGVESTVRPSFAFYNTFAEIDVLAAAVRRIRDRAPVFA